MRRVSAQAIGSVWGEAGSERLDVTAAAFSAESFHQQRSLERRAVSYAVVMAGLAVVSVVLAVLEVELTVVRLPQPAAQLLVGNCRTGNPSLLVRSGVSFVGIEGVMRYAPRALPASPTGFLTLGPGTQSGPNITGNTDWTAPVRTSPEVFCNASLGAGLPAAAGNSTAFPCAISPEVTASALLGIADRAADAGSPALRPRAWAIMLGSPRGCLVGLRGRQASTAGGFTMPLASEMAASRRTAFPASADAAIGAAAWPASSFAGSEADAVSVPAPAVLALEALAASVGGAEAAARSPAWRHALVALGMPAATSAADALSLAESLQPSAALRARALAAADVTLGAARGGWPALLALRADGNATGAFAPAPGSGGGFAPTHRSGGPAVAAAMAAASSPGLWGAVWWLRRGSPGATPLSLAAPGLAAAAGAAPGASLGLTPAETAAVRAGVSANGPVIGAAWSVRAAQSGVTLLLLLLTGLWHGLAARVRRVRRQAGPTSAIFAPAAAAADIGRAAASAACCPCRRAKACCVRRCPGCWCVAGEAKERRRRFLQRRSAARAVRRSVIHGAPVTARRFRESVAGQEEVDAARGRAEHRAGDTASRFPATVAALASAPGSRCQWGVAASLATELLVACVHMPVGAWPEAEAAMGPSLYVAVALAPALLRLHLLLRAGFLLSDLGTGSGRLIVALSGQAFTVSFFVKRQLREKPWLATSALTTGVVVFLSLALHAAETLACASSPVPSCSPLSLPEAVYMTVISVTTVGFGGRFTPRSTLGGVLVVLGSFATLLGTAVAVSELLRFMAYGAAEDQVTALLRKARVRTTRKTLAAAAIQAAWHWSQEHRQSLLWTARPGTGVVFRSAASRASASLRATGAVARWAAFRAVAGRQLLDADMGPRRRLLAAFTLLRVEEARESVAEILQAAAAAAARVTDGMDPELRRRVLPAVPRPAPHESRVPVWLPPPVVTRRQRDGAAVQFHPAATAGRQGRAAAAAGLDAVRMAIEEATMAAERASARVQGCR